MTAHGCQSGGIPGKQPGLKRCSSGRDSKRPRSWVKASLASSRVFSNERSRFSSLGPPHPSAASEDRHTFSIHTRRFGPGMFGVWRTPTISRWYQLRWAMRSFTVRFPPPATPAVSISSGGISATADSHRWCPSLTRSRKFALVKALSSHFDLARHYVATAKDESQAGK